MVFKKNFLDNLQKQNQKKTKKVSATFLAFSRKILTFQKVVLSAAQDRAIFEDLRLRGKS